MLNKICEKNMKTIDLKIQAPNEKHCIRLISETVKQKASEVNRAIQENNNLLSSIGEQKTKLMKKIWNYLAYESKQEIETYSKELEKISEEIELNNTKVDTLTTEISNLLKLNSELSTQTVNTKDAVNNINQILENSGFIGFKIKEKEKTNNISQYYLSRKSPSPEDVFNTLSEGEKNFVSFLYFYQQCIGVTNLSSQSKKKIIVIDDPVSSMDSQVLFIVSTLINRLIKHKDKQKLDKVNTDKQKSYKTDFSNKKINQVFIFTHNYYFYKEIAMTKRPICKSQSHYLVSKNSNDETFITKREYKECDDYSLMWNTLKEVKDKINGENHEQNIMLANLFRRILESYANFIGLGHDAWATVFQDTDKDSTEHYLKCAFISMINDESHKVSPFDSMYFQRIHNENPLTLFKVFESIFNVIGKEHYEKMMKD